MNKIIIPGLLLVMTFLFAGCNSTTFYVSGHEFDTEKEAMDFIKKGLGEQLAEIKPGHYFGGSIMVHIPSDDILAKPPFCPPESEVTAREIAFGIKRHKFNYGMMMQAIRKSCMFDCVQVVRQKDMIKYGRNYGYRYAFVYSGGRTFYLVDLMLEKDSEIEFNGHLNDIVLSIQDAVVKFEGVKRSSSLAEKFTPVDFHPEWDKTTRKGSVSVRVNGKPFECRAWLIGNIRKIVSGKKDPKGYLPELDIISEKLVSGIFTINFRSIAKRANTSKTNHIGLRDYYKTESKPKEK